MNFQVKIDEICVKVAKSLRKMEVNLLDVENCCRTCLKPAHLSLFHTFYKNISFYEIVNETTNVPSIYEGDGLTPKICEICRDRAIDAYNFRQVSFQVRLHDPEMEISQFFSIF